MKFITNILKNLIPKNISPNLILGRWKIEVCNVKINSKIDWSNEEYALYKLSTIQTKIVTKKCV